MVLERCKRGGWLGPGPIHRREGLLQRARDARRQSFHHHGLIGARPQTEALQGTAKTTLVGSDAYVERSSRRSGQGVDEPGRQIVA
jgi:hypothetical protein